jgi:glycosyltransferase involved in cell wall biosynthesis
MRVLMTADCVGGVWTYAATLCRALAAHDVDVMLAVTGAALSASQREEAQAMPNVDLQHRPYKCEWMDQPWADVAAAGEWISDLAAEWRADVVHLNDFAHGGRVLAGGAPKLLVAHSDVFSWFRHVRGQVPPPQFDEYRRRVVAGLVGADAVVAPTAAAMDDLERAYPEAAAAISVKATVIPNALERPHGGAPADRQPFILCAGRLWDEAKNVATLARAAAGLEWPVKLAGESQRPGDGGESGGGETVPLPENIELLGPLPRRELMRVMGQAAVYAMPARYEPFGLSALEAAQSGCALVLGNIPSLHEVWADAAVYVAPDDAGELRASLERMIRDEAHRRDMAAHARRRAARYTPDVMAEAYVELYRQLIHEAQAAEIAH